MFNATSYFLPSSNPLTEDQSDAASRMAWLNTAAALANMSAPTTGFAPSVAQLLTTGAQAYGQGANNYLQQFYNDRDSQAKLAQEESKGTLATLGVNRAIDHFKDRPWAGLPSRAGANIPAGSPASPAGIQPNVTLQDFYRTPLTQAQIGVESSGDPTAVSPKGAYGLMQLMPGTQKDPGFGVAPLKNSTPEENVRLGQDYQQAMIQKYGDLPTALMAYNWGPGNVDNWIANGRNPAQVPTETQQYVQKVMSELSQQPQQAALPSNAGVPLGVAPAMTPQGDQRKADELYNLGVDNAYLMQPGASDMMRMSTYYDPAMAGINAMNLPASIQLANEIAKARASGDTQRVNDLTAAAKLLSPGMTFGANGAVTAMPGFIDTAGAIEGGKEAGKVTGGKQAEAALAADNAIGPIEDLKKLNEQGFDSPFMGELSKLARLSPSEKQKEKAKAMDKLRQARTDLAAPLAKELGVNPTDRDFQSSLDRIFDINSSKESRAEQILALEHRVQARRMRNPYTNQAAGATPNQPSAPAGNSGGWSATRIN